mgnify:CR=1 FL=1
MTRLPHDAVATQVTIEPAKPGYFGPGPAGLVDGFDRDFGTYAEQLVVAARDTALVPDGLDLVTAATVPLNGLAAAQLVDLLGDRAEERQVLLCHDLPVVAFDVESTDDAALEAQWNRVLEGDFRIHAEEVRIVRHVEHKLRLAGADGAPDDPR